jgi:multidrug transporter EmrE-like cation transporter
MVSRVAAAVAASGFVVEGVAVVGHTVPDSHWGVRGSIVDAAFAVAALCAALALPAFSERLAVGRLGRAWAVVAQVGFVATAVESVASLVHGGNTLGPVFMIGLLLIFVGLIGLAVSGVRAAALRWAAPLPAVAMVVGIAAGDQGAARSCSVWCGSRSQR